MQDRLALLVLKLHILKRDVAANRPSDMRPPRLRILFAFIQNLGRPVQPCQRLSQLRADVH